MRALGQALADVLAEELRRPLRERRAGLSDSAELALLDLLGG
jgi:hypothetical protein